MALTTDIKTQIDSGIPEIGRDDRYKIEITDPVHHFQMSDALSLCLFYHLLIPPRHDPSTAARHDTGGDESRFLSHSGLVCFSLGAGGESPLDGSVQKRRGEAYRERQRWKRSATGSIWKPRPSRGPPLTHCRRKVLTSEPGPEPRFTLTFG